MITDQETNFVYFSKTLKQEKYSAFLKNLTGILKTNNIEYDFLSYTNDIWCRDYMPIQVSKNKFVQFKYDPIYSPITDAAEACKDIGIKPVISNIKLDGGNVVKSKTKVIMTKRVITDNHRHYPDHEDLLKELKDLLEVKQIIIIPEHPDDLFGHADGCIRFINSDSVVVNELHKEEKYFAADLKEVFRKEKLKYKEMPWFIDYDLENLNSAVGNYINYLEVGDLILIPEYKGYDKCNRMALAALRKVFGVKKIIEPVESTEIAKEGGVLNCISWNTRR
jgi:agmatine deiminase